MTTPAGILSNLPREVLNDTLGTRPTMDRCRQLYGTTHYNFRITQTVHGYKVTGIPFANWKERQEALMQEQGL